LQRQPAQLSVSQLSLWNH